MTNDVQNYSFHRLSLKPRTWAQVAGELGDKIQMQRPELALYGIWRSQIGRPRDELSVILTHPQQSQQHEAKANLALVHEWLGAQADIVDVHSESMQPTLRPSDARAPQRQGNYAFRWFETPTEHVDEFLDLCARAWPGFEEAYDSQVIGLWRCTFALGAFDFTNSGLTSSTQAEHLSVRTLLMTRRPDLAMWERSKIPANDAEAQTRSLLSRRYDLCDWTTVYTSTLLTASDSADQVRWT